MTKAHAPMGKHGSCTYSTMSLCRQLSEPACHADQNVGVQNCMWPIPALKETMPKHGVCLFEDPWSDTKQNNGHPGDIATTHRNIDS